MWPVEHTEITPASPAAVWALWENVPGWTQWDEGLDEIGIDGPFVAGTTGTIRPSGGPRLTFKLLKVERLRGFTDETKLPLCRLRFAHELAPADDGQTAITLRVSFHGPLRPLFQRVIGAEIARELAGQVARLARAAAASEPATKRTDGDEDSGSAGAPAAPAATIAR